MGRVDQHRTKLLTPPFVTANRQRPERVTMVALTPSNDLVPVRLTDFQIVLARHFHRRLDGFRATGDEIDHVQISGRLLHEIIG